MKQHSIPQNILDIEFKLFSKFTVKEFVYIAVGFVIGGLFLFIAARNDAFPLSIAIFLFILFAGFGTFLGVVPINDQSADTFLQNYITAITKPTRRVWKNKKFDKQFQEEAKARGIPVEQLAQTKSQSIQPQQDTQKVVGGTTQTNQFKQDTEFTQAEDQLDQEEQVRLQQIEESIKQLEGIAPGIQEKVARELEANPSLVESIQQDHLESPGITLNAETISKYAIEVENYETLPQTINLYVTNQNNEGLEGATVQIKDQDETPIQAIRSSEYGLALSQKQLSNGTYTVEISLEGYDFPKISFIMEEYIYPVIQIKSK